MTEQERINKNVNELSQKLLEGCKLLCVPAAHQRQSGLPTQPAMVPQGRVVLRAGDDNKIDLDSVDWSKADKADTWAQYKNFIYFGSVGIAVLLPVFFLVVKP